MTRRKRDSLHDLRPQPRAQLFEEGRHPRVTTATVFTRLPQALRGHGLLKQRPRLQRAATHRRRQHERLDARREQSRERRGAMLR